MADEGVELINAIDSEEDTDGTETEDMIGLAPPEVVGAKTDETLTDTLNLKIVDGNFVVTGTMIVRDPSGIARVLIGRLD